MSELASTNLFKPLTIGDKIELSHRVVVPPLTRARATEDHVPTDLQLEHYDEMTKTAGSLVISEATFVAPKAGGWSNVPGLWNDRQLKAWRKITDQVHKNGSYISCQLWNLGRQADVNELVKENLDFKSASNIYMDKESEQLAKKLNKPLTGLSTQEVKDYVPLYAEVASNAIEKAGFDIVEIHSAHGYLFDQFFQKISNDRTDEYGGSIENRARFFFEVLDAIVEKVGASRVACRISPWITFGGMAGAAGDPHPYATFGYIISELEKRRKQHDFAYLSIVEPRVNGSFGFKEEEVHGTNEWIYEIYKGTILRVGGYYDKSDPKNWNNLIKDVNANNRTLIGLGRISTSNPDLVERLRNGYELRPYERELFYTHDNWGYNTYPRYGQDQTFNEEQEKNRLGKPLA